ncbi:hypothetical protein OEA41_009014 [Lepraria neglecta]|uniref:Ankyrin n=1 Tax=Lepraria neglecta TaxID=209136 RepID=A0AAE0DHN4_9LECA|nr:hypothetical protein OEA41_009014 [Lepraria neglecta]
MNPISIFSVIQGSIGLALQCGNVIQSLNDIVGKFNQAHLTIISIIQEVETIQMAWIRIREWSEEHAEAGTDTNFFDRLGRSLDCGTLVMTALEQDLEDYNIKTARPTIGFRQRSRVAWNETALLDHQNRIRGQVQAMSLLLQVLELPTPKDRGTLLQTTERILRKSDESAYSIVPSRQSSLRAVGSQTSRASRARDSRISIESGELVYRPLSFEDELFTARVYKRNYRNAKMRSLFRSKSRTGIEGERISNRKISVTDHTRPERRSRSQILLRASEFLLGDSGSEPGSLKDDAEECGSILIALDNAKADTEDQHQLQLRNSSTERSDYLTGMRERRQSPQRLPVGSTDINIPTPIQEEFPKSDRDNTDEQAGESDYSAESTSNGELSGLDRQIGGSFLEEVHPIYDLPSTNDIGSDQALSDVDTLEGPSSEILHVVHPVMPELESVLSNAPSWGATRQTLNTALHSAVRMGKAEDVKSLLARGAQIDNDEDFQGWGPLHSAASAGNVAMTRLLVQEGAWVARRNHYRIQPIHLAARVGSLEVAQILFDGGASVDCTDDVGRQPLHFVSEHAEAPDMIEFLVSRGARVDVQDLLHRTPLRMARESSHAQSVGTLLNLRAK